MSKGGSLSTWKRMRRQRRNSEASNYAFSSHMLFVIYERVISPSSYLQITDENIFPPNTLEWHYFQSLVYHLGPTENALGVKWWKEREEQEEREKRQKPSQEREKNTEAKRKRSVSEEAEYQKRNQQLWNDAMSGQKPESDARYVEGSSNEYMCRLQGLHIHSYS